MWAIEYTDEFGGWWDGLRESEQDPRRTAILLIGGNKGGDDRFYDRMIPIADRLYDIHLRELAQEGLQP